MRQRIKLAQAIAHQPSVLVLDEPLNGLDPMARAEAIELFRTLASEGLHVIISSHILHEVDRISDQVVLVSNGYVVAEGQIQAVRGEMHQEHPLQILVRCSQPGTLAARLFAGGDMARRQDAQRPARAAGDARAIRSGSTNCSASWCSPARSSSSRSRRPTTTCTRCTNT